MERARGAAEPAPSGNSAGLISQARAGILAGLIAGTVMDAAYLAMQFASGTPAGKLPDLYVFIASALLGPAAHANPDAVAIGIVLHFLVATGWALGFVYLLRSQPQLLARPWLSGAAFGLVVFVFMQVVLITAGLYRRPPPAALGMTLLAHIVFYGIPVALVVARLLRPRSTRSALPA